MIETLLSRIEVYLRIRKTQATRGMNKMAREYMNTYDPNNIEECLDFLIAKAYVTMYRKIV